MVKKSSFFLENNINLLLLLIGMTQSIASRPIPLSRPYGLALHHRPPTRPNPPPPEQELPRPSRRENAPLADEPRGPQLLSAGAHRVAAHVAEITAEIRGRVRFSDVLPSEIAIEAETFARYRIANLASLRRTDREARAMLIKDLRETERRYFPGDRLVLLLL